MLTIGPGLSWPERAALACDKFGPEGTSEASLERLSKAVEGVDPINFAPALLPGHGKSGPPSAEPSPEAWALFLSILQRAGEDFPLIAAWRDVEDVKGLEGWDWPSSATVRRRWHGLPLAARLHARIGTDGAVKRLAQPAMRDKTTIRPLEWVPLDGRTLVFRVDFGDGRAVRPVMIALVDVASSAVLGWALSTSENARSTQRLIREVCERFGIFDHLCTDNGSAFAAHLVAGGIDKSFRGKARALEAVRPLGICHHLGIDMTFALPGNGQAKVAERSFASLSRACDDRPEFAGAHAGHAPGAAPDSKFPVRRRNRSLAGKWRGTTPLPGVAVRGCPGGPVRRFLRPGLRSGSGGNRLAGSFTLPG